MSGFAEGKAVFLQPSESDDDDYRRNKKTCLQSKIY